MSRVENALRPSPPGLVITPTMMSVISFPQCLPHPYNDSRILLFSGIAKDIHFSTGSTTNTKKHESRFCVVVVSEASTTKRGGKCNSALARMLF